MSRCATILMTLALLLSTVLGKLQVQLVLPGAAGESRPDSVQCCCVGMGCCGEEKSADTGCCGGDPAPDGPVTGCGCGCGQHPGIEIRLEGSRWVYLAAPDRVSVPATTPRRSVRGPLLREHSDEVELPPPKRS